MKEYRKNDVLEKLKAAFEAGMTMAKITRKYHCRLLLRRV